MRKRPFFSFLIILILILISGCQKDDKIDPKLANYEKMLNNSEMINLEVWTYYNNNQMIAFDQIVKDFNATIGKQKKIAVTHRSFRGINSLVEEIEKSSSQVTGSLPLANIIQGYADDVIHFDYKHQNVASVDKYFTDQELEQFIDVILNEGRYDQDNQLKIIPFAKSSEILVLNKTDWDQFTQESRVQPFNLNLEMLHTAEGLVEVSQLYYQIYQKSFFGRDAIANLFNIVAKSFDSSLFEVDPITKRGSLNFDRDLIEKVYQCYYLPYVNQYFASYGKYRSDDVATGDIISYVGSTTSADYFPNKVFIDDDNSYPIESYVMAPPTFKGGKQTAVIQGAGFYITKNPEVIEYASAIFLKYLTSAQNNLGIAVALGYLPVIKNALETTTVEEALIKHVLATEEKADTFANRQAIKSKYAVRISGYRIAIELFKNAQLCFFEPFINSSSVRQIIESSIQGSKTIEMVDLINASDLIELIKNDVASGIDLEVAKNARLEGNFERWYQQLITIITKELEK